MFKKTLKFIWNLLAVIGLACCIFAVVGGIYILKSYHYPPHILALKILKKTGIESQFIAEKLTPPPVRPPGLVMPDPGSPDWRGVGARNDRELEPVSYTAEGRPFPRSWLGKTDTGAYVLQNYLKKIIVTTSKELLTAIKKATPGDMIVLAPGKYPIRLGSIEVLRPGTLERPICIKAEKLGQVVIELNSGEGFLVHAPYWIFENLNIQGTNPVHDYGEHAFHVVGAATGFVLRNCRVYEFNAMIKANGSRGKDGKIHFPDNALIENNSFYNSTPRHTSNPVTFIDVVGPDNWIISGNFIADFYKEEGDTISYAAFVKGNASGTIFEKNLVIGEYRHTGGVRVGLSLGGGGTGKSYARDKDDSIEHTSGIIRNNVVMYCKDAGIYLNKAADTKIYHNLLYRTMGIDVRYPVSSAEIQNNILTSRVADRDGGQSRLSNNIILEKRMFGSQDLSEYFKNSQKADFSIKQGTNIVNKGRVLPGIFEDICGNARDGQPDIGPFEYSQNQVCTLVGN